MKTKIFSLLLFMAGLVNASHSQTTVTVTVTSTPVTGVFINISPLDSNGLGDDYTNFTRIYKDKPTITLNAPAEAFGYCFFKWVINGDVCKFLSANSFVADGDVTCEAVYVLPYILYVNAGTTPVSVFPADLNQQGDDISHQAFTRIYCPGTDVTLSVPAITGIAGPICFKGWYENGVLLNADTTMVVNMNSTRHISTVYASCHNHLTVQSDCPNTGVSIAVSETDDDGYGNGLTPFYRLYQNGYPFAYHSLTLTAPLHNQYGGDFIGWKKNGVWVLDLPVPNQVSFILDNDDAYRAVYDCQNVAAISLPMFSGCLGTITFPVMVNNFNDVASLSMTILFDPEVLNFTGIQNLDPQLAGNFFANAVNGILYMAWYGLTPVTLGNCNLLNLNFDASTGECLLIWDTIPGTNQLSDYYENPIGTLFTNGEASIINCPVNKYTLDITSSGPAGPVSIEVTPPDFMGLGDGSTPFSRLYYWGASVTLTAPVFVGNYGFKYWMLNNLPVANTPSISVTVVGNALYTAVYEVCYKLTVNASGPVNNLLVLVSQPDINHDKDGTTTFTRYYFANTQLDLSASLLEDIFSNLCFQNWFGDNGFVSFNPTIPVTITQDVTYTIVYGPTCSISVNSVKANNVLLPGVIIDLYQQETGGTSSLPTTFTNYYCQPAHLTLTAPAEWPGGSGKLFREWRLNNVYFSPNPSIQVNLNLGCLSQGLYTAVYDCGPDDYAALWVKSENPDQGVQITGSPAGGTTPFGYSFHCGENIMLNAPPYVGSYYFVEWVEKNHGYTYPLNQISFTMEEEDTYTARYAYAHWPPWWWIITEIGPPASSAKGEYCQGVNIIPVTVENFKNVASFSLSLEYDPDIFTFIDTVNFNPALKGADFVVNSFNNEVRMAWYSMTPVTLESIDTLTELAFSVNSGLGTLAWDTLNPGQCQYNLFDESIIDAAFYDGSATFGRCNGIEGKVTYQNDVNTRLPGCEVILKKDGIIVNQTITGYYGDYQFEDLEDGNYSLQVNSPIPWGGVNSSDALIALRFFAGLAALLELQVMAANVDNAGIVNANDAYLIAARFVELVPSFPLGDWVFEETVRNISGPGVIKADIQGLCAGELNASYYPFTRINPSVSIENEGIVLAGKEMVNIPVKVTNTCDVSAISLVINLPDAFTEVKDIVVPGDGQLAWNKVGNELRIAWYSLEPRFLNSGDVLLNLSCKLKTNEGVAPQSVSLNLTGASELADATARLIPDARLTYPTLIREGNDLYLGQNIPNPFDRYTEIPYYLPEDGKVTIKVFDMLGKVVLILADELQNSGTHQVRIDENNLRPGVYTYQLEFHNNNLQTCKSLKMVVN
ncbi:MAG: T9SS type A sorting domain-containing protein [Bacteroidetes bacterium]|nr:T9SS type A sorting domain-containing protein [Bacteroidota bacterium]